MQNTFESASNRMVYLLHHFFSSLSLNLFFTFGALLIYAKTQSILIVLTFAIVGALVIVLTFTLGFTPFIKILNKLGLKKSMVFGLISIACVDLSLFFIPLELGVSFIGLVFVLAAIRSFSANFYYTPVNAVRFEFIGSSEAPGRLSALVTNVGVFGGLAAIFAGLLAANSQAGFLYLFIISGISLIISIIILFRVALPNIIYEARFPAYLKSIPKETLFAFTEFSHELQRTIVPLIVLTLFSVFATSVWVTALSSLGTLLGVYVTGKMKDDNKNTPVILAGVIIVSTWILYGFSFAPWQFIILGVLLGISMKTIATARDARFGREATNGLSAFEAIFPIEISKAFSRLLILCFLLILFVFTHELPQLVLLLGAVFMLPPILYALGAIAKKKIDRPHTA